MVLSALRRAAQRATNPLRLGDPCRMLRMDFGESPLPRTLVNKGKKKGRSCYDAPTSFSYRMYPKFIQTLTHLAVAVRLTGLPIVAPFPSL